MQQPRDREGKVEQQRGNSLGKRDLAIKACEWRQTAMAERRNVDRGSRLGEILCERSAIAEREHAHAGLLDALKRVLQLFDGEVRDLGAGARGGSNCCRAWASAMRSVVIG